MKFTILQLLNIRLVFIPPAHPVVPARLDAGLHACTYELFGLCIGLASLDKPLLLRIFIHLAHRAFTRPVPDSDQGSASAVGTAPLPATPRQARNLDPNLARAG